MRSRDGGAGTGGSRQVVLAIDLHTHILPETWPDLAARYGEVEQVVKHILRARAETVQVSAHAGAWNILGSTANVSHPESLRMAAPLLTGNVLRAPMLSNEKRKFIGLNGPALDHRRICHCHRCRQKSAH